MSPSNRKNLVIAMFATPVILCFIGMGALLNMLVFSMHEEQLANVDASQKYQDAIAENQRHRDELAGQEARAEQARKEKEEEDKAAEEERANNEAAEDWEKKTAESEAGNDGRREQVPDKEKKTAQLPGVRQQNARLNVSLEKLKQDLQEAETELQRLSAECDVARKEKDKERRRVDVTALDGTRKVSDHKPVFVECSRGKAILQPQERTLSADPGAADRETLLAAARRTRYVVFLVRPDGFRCFENYRSFVISAGQKTGAPIEFGYEPVNADWELVFPGKEG